MGRSGRQADVELGFEADLAKKVEAERANRVAASDLEFVRDTEIAQNLCELLMSGYTLEGVFPEETRIVKSQGRSTIWVTMPNGHRYTVSIAEVR